MAQEEKEPYCRLERRGNFFVLTLIGDGEHRINPPLVDAILACLQTLRSLSSPSTCTALITTGHGKFFSNGLDLAFPSRDAVRRKFAELLSAYINLPMPTIAAVCGHAAAAGFILALAHDYVYMRKDRGFLYMSEIDVRILIPPGPMNIIRSKLTPRAFRDAVLCGIKHTAGMALEAGIVDSMHGNAESTREAAFSKAEELVARKWNPDFYREMRAAMYPEVFAAISKTLEDSDVSAMSKL
ncbi:hypothetical protein GOP47_0018774 [Adiantum capillus-veneris]|uniref:Delta(3)-Delta(2)-enoyl-CoA isomerase n=1 Tax=Adiantum capillus-veneris TaxID=13818 RepID=A0A9D4UE63_ADICA|nr:hypothetical protein GOP47_0018774 [Adiantum capillus-veneris]